MAAASHLLALLALCLVGANAGARIAAYQEELVRTTSGRPSPHFQELTAQALQDRVDELPGWGVITGFRLFSGYITVDAEAGRHLAYVFVESQGPSPATDPLLLWLNGGPGCSSFGGGFLSELGPWLPKAGGVELQVNPYSWNREAHVLFVESPAFVGFSYSETASDAIVGDTRTARDMRAFLLGFFERYPHLAELDFYISGESYAGHYLPTLAWEIVEGNKHAHEVQARQVPPVPPAPIIKFKGVLLGNPWTDAATDNLGAVDFWWSHALISDEVALGIKANCDFEHIGPLDQHSSTSNPHTRSGACDHFCNVAQSELSGINIYEIFADLCYDGDAAAPRLTLRQPSHAVSGSTRQARVANALVHQLTRGVSPNTGLGDQGESREGLALLAAPVLVLGAPRNASLTLQSLGAGQAAGGSGLSRTSRLGRGVVRRSPSSSRRLAEDNPDEDDGPVPYDPCVDVEVNTYLNLPEVQRALHVNVSGDLPGPWRDCTEKISYSREDLLSSMLPIWHKLIGVRGLRFLVYSGDVDGIVPVVGTRRWVASLGLPVVRAWQPWLSGPPSHAQVGGYAVEFELPWQKEDQQDDDADEGQVGALKGAFMFATVRNAGHMVPYVQPQRALHLMARFLSKQAL